MNILEYENKIVIEDLENFNLTDIFECGQCFRFNKVNKMNQMNQTNPTEEIYEGIAYGKYLRAYQENNRIYLETTLEDFNHIWRVFFDLDRDYKKIADTLCKENTDSKDTIIKKAADFSAGIRILKQEPFECLISFIISQNNNIPRIKKIINRLCENFGEKIAANQFAFPSAAKLAGLSLDDLKIINAGFRAKYILEAAQKIYSGEINLDLIHNLSLDEGAEYLKKLKGVGDKVSACVLLFAYNKLDAFPIDVWIKKILEKYYGGGYDFGEYAGIANSYLFYYERNNK